jgi:ABC-type glycerol-3-phosphate transport system permease component/peptidoglycan/LPS O-acetylase OafA/YrhL
MTRRKSGGSDFTGLWYVAAFFALFMVFGVFGLAFNFFVSFNRWQPISEDPSFRFHALKGYVSVLSREDFWLAVGQSLLSAIPSLLVLHFVAFTLAYGMYLLFRKHLAALGMLMFVPYMAVPIGLFSSLSWFSGILITPLNDLLGVLRVVAPSLPEQLPFFSMYSIFFVMWKNLGWNMLLYMMAFAAIPRSTLEAAALDGAGFWKQVTHIALPLARPMVFVALSMGLGSALQSSNWRPGADFGEPPVGVPALSYREAFGYQNFDAASVMTCVFFAIMLLLVLLIYVAFGRNFTQIEQPSALETNTMPVTLPPLTRMVIQLLVVFIGIICLLPFLISLSQATQHQSLDKDFIQGRLALEGSAARNYSGLLNALPGFWRNFWNSLYVSGLAAIGATTISALAGYSFATLEFAGKRFLFGVVMCAMVFPAMSNAIPYVIQMRVFDWLNTPRALWFPAMISALGVFLVRQYALNALPKLMLEAARVDGASTWRIFWRIALPNLTPVLIAVALLVFVSTWNGLDAAYFVMRDLETRLLPDILQLLTGPQVRTALNEAGQDMNFFDAAAMGSALSTIPVLIVFVLASKQFGRGLGIGEWTFSWRTMFASIHQWFIARAASSSTAISSTASSSTAISSTASSSPTGSASTGSSSTLAGVTGFRGVVVIFLIMGHIWQRLQVTNDMPQILGSIQGFFSSGGFRVSSFFVLSGMLLSLPFWQRYLRGDAIPNLRTFARRRFLRIAPAYWVALIVSFVFSGMLFGEGTWRWLRLLSGLTFTSGLHYVTFFPVELNGPLWSIGYEALFYIAMPLFMLGLFALRKFKPGSMPFAITYWLLILATMVLGQEWLLRNAVPDSFERSWDFGLVGGAKTWFPNYSPVGFFGHYVIGVLSAGCIAWWQKRSLERNRAPQHVIFDVIALISSLGAMAMMYLHTKTSEFAWSIGEQPAAFPFFTAIIGLLLASLPFSHLMQRLLDTRFLKYTARISFSLFLWHHLILELIWIFHDYGYNRFGGLPQLANWAWISLGALILIYGIGHLSYEHIEKPFLESGKPLRERSRVQLNAAD